MLVAGVAVPDQNPGERRPDATGLDGVAAAVPDVHRGQEPGAGHVQVGQRACGAGGGLISVGDRRGSDQCPHMRQEPGLEQSGGLGTEPGDPPGRHREPEQCVDTAAPAVPAGMRARQPRRPSRDSGPVLDPARRDPGCGRLSRGAAPAAGRDGTDVWTGTSSRQTASSARMSGASPGVGTPSRCQRMAPTRRRVISSLRSPENSQVSGHPHVLPRRPGLECAPRRFDPSRALVVPRSIAALIGTNPRVIADEVWAKLLWAGLTLTDADLPGTSAGTYYPMQPNWAIT